MHCMHEILDEDSDYSEVCEGRLLRKVAREAVKCGKGVWIKNMAICKRDFELQDMGVDTIKDLCDQEIS